MNILMISGDKKIMDEKSGVHARMVSYARVAGELHVIVLTDRGGLARSYGSLFLYPAAGNKLMRRFLAYRIAQSIAKSRAIDVITAQSPDEIGLIAYAVARSFGIPLQLQVHTDIMSPWYRRAGIVPRMKYMFARFLLRRADCLRVVSHRIMRSLTRELNIPESSIMVLPVFTDMHPFMHGEATIQDARMQKSDCKIIAVGRFLDREKNFSMLIRAMADVVRVCPHTVLKIVGDGPDKQYYESLIATLHLNDHVFLEPWREDLAAFYRSFDVFVLPSYIEGWGMAVIEAMAAGLAVVMTDVGVAGEVVRDDINGSIVPVNDQSMLADALIRLCQSPEKRNTYAKAARETVLHLTPRTKDEYLIQWQKSFDCCKSIL